MSRVRALIISLAVGSLAILPAALLSAGPASAATGVNQYASGTAAPSGLCHGAFANTNGSFGYLGPAGGSTGGGVPAGSPATGWNNSGVSGDCTLG